MQIRKGGYIFMGLIVSCCWHSPSESKFIVWLRSVIDYSLLVKLTSVMTTGKEVMK